MRENGRAFLLVITVTLRPTCPEVVPALLRRLLTETVRGSGSGAAETLQPGCWRRRAGGAAEPWASWRGCGRSGSSSASCWSSCRPNYNPASESKEVSSSKTFRSHFSSKLFSTYFIWTLAQEDYLTMRKNSSKRPADFPHPSPVSLMTRCIQAFMSTLVNAPWAAPSTLKTVLKCWVEKKTLVPLGGHFLIHDMSWSMTCPSHRERTMWIRWCLQVPQHSSDSLWRRSSADWRSVWAASCPHFDQL